MTFGRRDVVKEFLWPVSLVAEQNPFTVEAGIRFPHGLRGGNSEVECLVANEDVEIAKFSHRSIFFWSRSSMVEQRPFKSLVGDSTSPGTTNFASLPDKCEDRSAKPRGTA